jgi:parallel beta-helix repeat protein
MAYKRQLLPYPEHYFYFKRIPKNPIPKQKSPESYTNSSCLFVGGIGNNNHSKIQSALNDATDGDTVFVYNGTYYENLIINNSIHLIGENKDNVILKCRDRDILKVNANNVEISGLTIDAKKLDTWDDSAIELASSGNFIHNNKLINSEWYGIHINNSSYNIIENNSIINISIGIWIFKSNANILRNNNITLCNWVGMWIWHSSRDNVIQYNNFIENRINIQNSDPRFKNKFDKNYWDDYFGLRLKRLADLNNNGFGSIPYRISKFNFDWHPLMDAKEK